MSWWPWCWRAELEATEARLKWTEEQLRGTEGKLAYQVASTTRLLAIAEDRIAEEREKRTLAEHKLFDRIAQMSGQPAIFEKPAAEAVPAATQPAPEPPRRITFDDVHKAARSAMERGDFQVPRGRLN